jgi:hypothetical protein
MPICNLSFFQGGDLNEVNYQHVGVRDLAGRDQADASADLSFCVKGRKMGTSLNLLEASIPTIKPIRFKKACGHCGSDLLGL